MKNDNLTTLIPFLNLYFNKAGKYIKSGWNRKKIATLLCVVSMVMTSVNLAWFEGKACINLPLCVLISLSPLALLINGTRVFIPRVDLPMGLMCLCIIAFPLLFHPETVRWSSMLFTCAYCIYFMMFARLLRISNINAEIVSKTIKILIYAFAGVLVVQQICLILGLPVFLESLIHSSEVPFKLNSLTAEASHSVVISTSLMLIYAQTVKTLDRNLTFFKEIIANKWIWICFGYTLFTSYSSSAFVLWPLPVLPFINRHNILWLLSTVALFIIIIEFTPLNEMYLTKRARRAVEATLTLDEHKMIEADASAAARTVPTIWGFKSIDLNDANTFIGHGIDAINQNFPPRPGTEDNERSAGIFTLWHTYGAICAFLFWIGIFMATYVKGRWITIITFLFALQLSADYNMQLVWQVMTFGLIYKYSICRDRQVLRPCNDD